MAERIITQSKYNHQIVTSTVTDTSTKESKSVSVELVTIEELTVALKDNKCIPHTETSTKTIDI